MSDLQCPATLLLARHGDAAHAQPDGFGDDGGWLSAVGRSQVLSLAASLQTSRVAAIYTSAMRGAVESGDVASEALGVRASVVAGLEELSVRDLAGLSEEGWRAQEVFDAWLAGDLDAGCPGGETGHQVVARFRDAAQQIADQHRGETILVFSHGGVMSLVIPLLSHNMRGDVAAQRLLPHAVPARVEIDSDGWRVLSWPGSTDPVGA